MKPFAPLALALLVLPSVALATGSPRDETEHLNRADMTLAKRATVCARATSPLGGAWFVRASAASGEQCTSFDPDLSAFVITGKHETIFEHGTSGRSSSPTSPSSGTSGRCRRLQGERDTRVPALFEQARCCRAFGKATLRGPDQRPRAWQDAPSRGAVGLLPGGRNDFSDEWPASLPDVRGRGRHQAGPRIGQCSCSWRRWRLLEVRSPSHARRRAGCASSCRSTEGCASSVPTPLLG